MNNPGKGCATLFLLPGGVDLLANLCIMVVRERRSPWFRNGYLFKGEPMWDSIVDAKKPAERKAETEQKKLKLKELDTAADTDSGEYELDAGKERVDRD